MIEVSNVTKDFRVFKREKGFAASLKSIITRNYEIKKAVNNINFNIQEGELVGYIGANGAGKSTTIKMLAGILVPTSGLVKVNGKEPYLNRKENAMDIGVVFGQRTQLYWNLPMEETFDLFAKIYKINPKIFRNNVEYYVDLLEMKPFLRTPVRQLSLGQRMRAELAVALLHDPKILYLDEPTIGLDVAVKAKIRNFIKQINKTKKTTVILTTHDMKDIEEVCDRIITINKGEVIFDNTVTAFKNNFNPGHVLTLDLDDKDNKLNDNRLKLLKDEGFRKSFLFNKNDLSVAQAISIISKNYEIKDMQLKEPDIEEAVKYLYAAASKEAN
ncbi:ABC-2 type transport system ATP-binding protein [Paenibacillus turicensis]|uniref:ABC-2 type transport system ATP-binding protein n=1 Tax=Paenibacillus turicensis TaxID=160487 RepID=A0ABS4FQM4_9BACL|nr:ATP-binding cassette domain-containing protein [Paenibacillus turicensis]MBP1904871.1 ABC-2 type transport system ATP-binding protein [Paenibacillus turicensis]